MSDWQQVWVCLLGFREHLPTGYFNRALITEYHELVNELEAVSGRDLKRFRVPESDLRPKVIGANLPRMRRPGEVFYSDEDYCERSSLLRRLDPLIEYLRTIPSNGVAVTAVTGGSALQRERPRDSSVTSASRVVFISYSHDGEDHEDRVLALADQLCRDGVDAILDQYEHAPPEGWDFWMQKQFRDADYVVMVCSAPYSRRVTGQEQPGRGLGASWEGRLISEELYRHQGRNARFVPVLFDGGGPEDIPALVRTQTHYVLPAEYDSLLRHITNQPRTPKPELGSGKILPARPRPSLFATTKATALSELQSRIEIALSRAGLEGQPSFALGATPTAMVDIPALVSSSQAPVVQLLQHPPTLRTGGFGIYAGDELPIVESGRARRAISRRGKLLELWRDGTLIFIGRGDEEFLCRRRPQNPDAALRLHPLVLTECTYLFCCAVKQLSQFCQPEPSAWQFALELRRLNANGQLPTLSPEKVGESEIPPLVSYPAPYGGERFQVTIAASQPPERMAFQLVSDVYLWFGIELDAIPYTTEKRGDREVDPSQIAPGAVPWTRPVSCGIGCLELKERENTNGLTVWVENTGLTPLDNCSLLLKNLREWAPAHRDFRRNPFPPRTLMTRRILVAGPAPEAFSLGFLSRTDKTELQIQANGRGEAPIDVREGIWCAELLIQAGSEERIEERFFEWKRGENPRFIPDPRAL